MYQCVEFSLGLKGCLTKPEAVVQRCSAKKVFLKISQNSQENTCARISFLIKFRPATLLEKRLWHSWFLRTPFLQNTSGGCFYKSYNLNHLKKTGGNVQVFLCSAE